MRAIRSRTEAPGVAAAIMFPRVPQIGSRRPRGVHPARRGTGPAAAAPEIAAAAHPEVIARLERCGGPGGSARHADGEAPAGWFRQHCDPILAVLMEGKAGPLSDCKSSPTSTASTPMRSTCQ